jgi:hypothetical protein
MGFLLKMNKTLQQNNIFIIFNSNNLKHKIFKLTFISFKLIFNILNNKKYGIYFIQI